MVSEVKDLFCGGYSIQYFSPPVLWWSSARAIIGLWFGNEIADQTPAIIGEIRVIPNPLYVLNVHMDISISMLVYPYDTSTTTSVFVVVQGF